MSTSRPRRVTTRRTVTNLDRLVVAVTGVYLLFAATQLRTLHDLDDAGLRTVWPWWFAAAGVACILFALFPTADLLALSGALAVSACAGRALAVLLLITRLYGGTIPARAPLAAATWAALASLIAVMWLRVFRPLIGRR